MFKYKRKYTVAREIPQKANIKKNKDDNNLKVNWTGNYTCTQTFVNLKTLGTFIKFQFVGLNFSINK